MTGSRKSSWICSINLPIQVIFHRCLAKKIYSTIFQTELLLTTFFLIYIL